jgi:hypothetical protein
MRPEALSAAHEDRMTLVNAHALLLGLVDGMIDGAASIHVKW